MLLLLQARNKGELDWLARNCNNLKLTPTDRHTNVILQVCLDLCRTDPRCMGRPRQAEMWPLTQHRFPECTFGKCRLNRWIIKSPFPTSFIDHHSLYFLGKPISFQKQSQSSRSSAAVFIVPITACHTQKACHTLKQPLRASPKRLLTETFV